MNETDPDLQQSYRELIQLLVLEAGRLIEDAALAFAMTLPPGGPQRTSILMSLRRTMTAASSLLDAAICVTNIQGEQTDAAEI